MLLYVSIFFILLLFAYFEVLSNNKRFSIGTFSIIIFIFFILSFIRWETGTDWENYYRTFTRIKTPWSSLNDPYANFEWGFMFLYNLAKTFSNSYTAMLFIEGLILYCCLFTTLKRYSIYPIYSIFMYYSMSLGGIFFVRQNIAMWILLCSIPFIIKRKVFKFIFTVIIAALIHRTAIIFLIAYPIFYKRYKLRQIILFLISSIIVGLISSKLFITALSNLELGIITHKLNTYLNAGSEENYTSFSATSVLIRGLINRSFLVVLYLTILNKFRVKDPLLNGFINLNLLGIVFYTVLTPLAFSLGRISTYFDLIQILIIPYVLKYSNYQTKHILLSLLTIYMGFRLLTIIYSFPDEYIPYKTVFGL